MNRLVLPIAIIVLLTGCVYWQVYTFDYVQWDDTALVMANPAIEGITLKNVGWAFTSTHLYNWHPLTWLSYMLDVELFGRHPAIFHIVNAVLHAGSGCLLLLLVRAMTGDIWKATFVAAVFAVHPLHVESVAWISERKDVLSVFFGLAAMLAYVSYVKWRRMRKTCYVLALLAFTLSLLAKQTLVTLPFVLLLLDWWPLRRTSAPTSVPDAEGPSNRAAADKLAESAQRRPVSWKWLILEKLPFFVLALVFCVIVYIAQRPGEEVPEYAVYPLWVRSLNAVLAYGLYLKKSLWPYELAAFYPHPGADISLWAVAASATVLVAITAVAVAARRTCPPLLVGWLWYLGTLIPVLGLIQVGQQQLADRYMYFPLIGLTISLAWAVPRVVPPGVFRDRLLPSAAVLLVAVLALAAHFQAKLWENTATLFQHTVDNTRDNYVAHNVLANALWEQGAIDEALVHYERAVSLNPQFAAAHHNLANLSRDRGDLAKAELHYRAALEARPDDPSFLTEYGELLLMLNRAVEALPKLERAVELAPYFAQAHNNLGQGLAAVGRDREALAEFAKALLIEPEYLAANCNAAMVLVERGTPDEAVPFIDAALRAAPGSPYARGIAYTVHLEWGRKLAQDQDHRQAAVQFEQAALLAGNRSQAHQAHLGAAESAATWDSTAARSHFERAIEFAPGSAPARLGLGKLLLDDGEHDAALVQLREAVRLSPDDPSAQEALRAAEAAANAPRP